MIRSVSEDTPTHADDIHDSPVSVGELLNRKYRVERLIGVGGMGVVVAAWHTELQQRVALKFLRRSFSQHPEAAERFRREARAAARISSDHVVRVFDVATLEDGVPYMVMEYLEGETLQQLLETIGPLKEAEVAAIVIQVCEALADAHANQIIHRDLKPENIYLTHRSGRPPMVKVLDFGVSKSLALNTAPQLKLTQASMLVGSPLYMSPEQLDSKRDIDARSDIWGAGVLIHELLTLQMPFMGETLPQIIQAILTGQRRPLAEIKSDISQEMEHIVSRCLAPVPDDRFAAVQKLAQALRPLALVGDEWATRLEPHLVPSAADAGAYGRAHILGESIGEESAIVSVEPGALRVSRTLSSRAGLSSNQIPGFRRRRWGFGAAIASLLAAATAAAVALFVGSRPPDSATVATPEQHPRISGATTDPSSTTASAPPKEPKVTTVEPNPNAADSNASRPSSSPPRRAPVVHRFRPVQRRPSTPPPSSSFEGAGSNIESLNGSSWPRTQTSREFTDFGGRR